MMENGNYCLGFGGVGENLPARSADAKSIHVAEEMLGGVHWVAVEELELIHHHGYI